MRYRVRWPDGHEVEAEGEKVKHARRRAVAKRQEADGYVTAPDEYRALEVQPIRNTNLDACLVEQAADGNWWLVVNPAVSDAGRARNVTAPCPHCEKPVVIAEQLPGNLPGRPFVLWEFKDRDDAEALCTMVNVMILAAVMNAAAERDEQAVPA